MNCLITGASSGIGRELAKKMASLGYDLFLTYYKNKELCEKFQKEIQEQYFIKCFIQKCDLKEEKEIQEVINYFQEKLGSLDILVNNAATYCDNLFLKKTKDEFLEVLEVNVVGTFLMSKYAISIMKDNGLIINMASTDGIDTYNLYNVDYAVSKAGIIQLTKSMSLIFKNSAKKNLSEPFIKQLPAMGMNMNIVEETGFATYMALRDPNRKNILSAVIIFAFSALTLSAKKFVEGLKAIWIKKQDADIQRDLQEDLIEVETRAFSGKLALQRNMLSKKGEYFKTALENQNKKTRNDSLVYNDYFNFAGSEKTNANDKENNLKRFLNPYSALSALMLTGALILGAMTFKNIKSGAKLQEDFIENFKKRKQKILDDIITNKINDKNLMKDTLIKMGASSEKAKECAQRAGFSQSDIEDIVSQVSYSVENIWGNAPTGMSTESGKSFFYCYLNETRGHLYNWLIHNDNPFLRNLFLAMATISSTSYIAQEAADAIKEVAVLKENAKTELNLQKRLVEVDINNFKAKKESAVAPLIEEFERQRKEGKAPEELKVMADNILLEIKNGPPFVYS